MDAITLRCHAHSSTCGNISQSPCVWGILAKIAGSLERERGRESASGNYFWMTGKVSGEEINGYSTALRTTIPA